MKIEKKSDEHELLKNTPFSQYELLYVNQKKKLNANTESMILI